MQKFIVSRVEFIQNKYSVNVNHKYFDIKIEKNLIDKNSKVKIVSALKDIYEKKTNKIKKEYNNFLIIYKKYYDFAAFRVYENNKKELDIVYLFTIKHRELANQGENEIKNVLFKIYSDRMNNEFVRKIMGNNIGSSIESLLLDIDARNSLRDGNGIEKTLNFNYEEDVKKILENYHGNFIEELEKELVGDEKHLTSVGDIDIIRFKQELEKKAQ